jgi:hypothetical protein
MDVSVAPGSVAVPLATGQGSALCTWDAPEVVTIAAAPGAGQVRRDRIVVQVRDPDLDGGADNDFVVAAVAGVPDVPATVTNPDVPPNAYALVTVEVKGGDANLNNAALWDERGGGLATIPYFHTTTERDAYFAVLGGAAEGTTIVLKAPVGGISPFPYFQTFVGGRWESNATIKRDRNTGGTLSGGYIVKMGMDFYNTNGAGWATVTFEEPFPNACEGVIPSMGKDTSGGVDWRIGISVANAAGFNAFPIGSNGSGIASNVIFWSWIAFGR